MIPDYPIIIILSICGLYIYARNLMTEMTILMLHKNVSRETSDSDGLIPLENQLPSSRRELP